VCRVANQLASWLCHCHPSTTAEQPDDTLDPITTLPLANVSQITLTIEGRHQDGTRQPLQLLNSVTAEDRVAQLLSEGTSVSDVSKQIAKSHPAFGRRKAYKLAMKLGKKNAAQEQGSDN